MDYAERQEILQAALDAAADGDDQIGELADALAGRFPQFGHYSALELLAKMGWLLMELGDD